MGLLIPVYDLTHDEWKALPKKRTMRGECVGVTWQGKIHVGVTAHIGPCSAEVYNSERDKWDPVVGMWQSDVPPNQVLALVINLFSSEMQ
ncbi:hypothetical protein Peur_065960 [Populus x canadensis]